jgi:hypothetical protein
MHFGRAELRWSAQRSLESGRRRSSAATPIGLTGPIGRSPSQSQVRRSQMTKAPVRSRGPPPGSYRTSPRTSQPNERQISTSTRLSPQRVDRRHEIDADQYDPAMLQGELQQVLDLQRLWNQRNTPEMQERGKRVRSHVAAWLADHRSSLATAIGTPAAEFVSEGDGLSRKERQRPVCHALARPAWRSCLSTALSRSCDGRVAVGARQIRQFADQAQNTGSGSWPSYKQLRSVARPGLALGKLSQKHLQFRDIRL